MLVRTKIILTTLLLLLVVGIAVFLLGPVLFASIAYPAPPDEFRGPIAHWSQQYGLSPNFMCALIFTESGFHKSSVSGAGAVGPTQFLPSTARGVYAQIYGADKARSFNPYDLTSNVDLAVQLGAYYISSRIHDYSGDVRKGLIGYNGGPRAVVAYEQGAPIPGTLAYANKIIAIEKAYDEIYGQWWQNVSYTPSPNPPATSPPAPTSPPAVQRAQFTIQPKVTTDLVGTIPLLDFWKQFISNQNNSPASTSTSTPSSPVIDNLWRAFLPGG